MRRVLVKLTQFWTRRRTLKCAQPFLVVVGLALGGCASSHQAVSFAPMTGRSLSLDSSAQRQLAERMPQDELPWYAVRNEIRPFVQIGVASPTYQSSATYTHDQIYSSGGRAWDHYSQTTYRHRVRATVH